MSEEKVAAEEELQPPAIGGTFLTMMFMLWIIINPDLRVSCLRVVLFFQYITCSKIYNKIL